MSDWYKKRCSNCGGKFSCHVDWENVPEFCNNCVTVKGGQRYSKNDSARASKTSDTKRSKLWAKKKCSQCDNQLDYHLSWTKIPDLCNDCAKVLKNRKKEAAL